MDRIHKNHFMKGNPPKGIYVVRGETDKSSNDYQTRWPEVWTKIGKAAQKREKQEWKNDKPELDNAQRLRRIYFFDLKDEEYKEIIKKKARRKLEVQMNAAMPCKKRTKNPTSFQETGARLNASNKVPKTKYA